MRTTLRGLAMHGSPQPHFSRIVSVGITLELLTSIRKLMGAIGILDDSAEAAGRDRNALVRSEYDATGNGAFSQFSHYFVCLRQGARGYLAVKLSSSCHGQHATQIFACANR